MSQDKIITANKELILGDGSVHKVSGDEKKKIMTADGREIEDPIVVSAEEFTNITAAVQAFPMLRDMIILLRATIENEMAIYDQRKELLNLAEIGAQKRLKDVSDIVTARLGTNPKIKET